MHPRKPRKIILLSDGTGNSSISRDKSNVWRLFQSLDLGADESGFHEQIAFYDDGVGTSGFRPLMALGGAFGWGLSRNVRELYAQLCRHYQPGDRIYIFGFSRGAFTARVLAHFIGACGILDTSKEMPAWPALLDDTEASKKMKLATEDGFNRAVKKAYKSYRQKYWRLERNVLPSRVSSVFRFIRNKILRSDVLKADDFKENFSYDLKATHPDQKEIEFIGVWDTVDALGLPIDELADVLDKYIYPYRFEDQILGDYVEKAAHALAIDDERHSFHPVLWDQSSELDKKRIQQVWFAGMHSNVGGGYPEDGLALTALKWMMDSIDRSKIGEAGITFNDDKASDFEKHALSTGKMYNSRRGAGVFYRYRPRNIYRLCHDKNSGKSVDTGDIVLHHTVTERIRDMNAGYAPAGIPRKFLICEHNGSIVEPGPEHQYYETPQQMKTRGDLLSQSEDHIAWGRFSYFSMLIVAFALIAFPFAYPGIPGWVIDYSEYGFWATPLNGIAEIVAALETVIPRFWTDAWHQKLVPFLSLVALFLVIFYWGRWIKANIQELAEAGWADFKGNKLVAPETGWFTSLAHYIRANKSPRMAKGLFTQKLMPCVFFGAAFFGILIAGMRTVELPAVANTDLCTDIYASNNARYLSAGIGKETDIDVSIPCIETGIDMEEGRLYHVKFTPDKRWMDASFEADNRGLENPWDNLKFPFPVAVPIRRDMSLPWFALTAQIGQEEKVSFPINRNEFTFKATGSGPLYLYVNDAINMVKFSGETLDTAWFYKNNSGTARVTVTKVQ